MIEIFGYHLSGDVIAFAFIINLLLLAIAVIGFTNLRKQIRELKTMLHQIQQKQKKLKE